MKSLRIVLQILLPLVILGGGLWLAYEIASRKPEVIVDHEAFVGPLVRTYTAATADIRIDIRTQGVVEADQSIELSAQVGGRVVAVAAALRAGGFFAAGDVLVSIERTDYELMVTQQQAAVARAELRLQQENAEAEAALRAWRELEGERPADPLVRREPQIAEATKALEAAKAMLRRSELDLDRTDVRAPFAGRVRDANVDTGHIVRPGIALAQLYGTERAEIRLPLPVSDAAFLELPLHWSDSASPTPKPHCDLTANFGGRRHSYVGTIIRTAGEVDRKTQQITVIARVEAPYARGESGDRPPLAIGTFVEASIRGRVFRDVVAVPRAALRGENEVWLLDAEHRLRRRQVDILRLEPDRVLIQSGLHSGDIVCTTVLDTPVDGMPVRIAAEPPR